MLNAITLPSDDASGGKYFSNCAIASFCVLFGYAADRCLSNNALRFGYLVIPVIFAINLYSPPGYSEVVSSFGRDRTTITVLPPVKVLKGALSRRASMVLVPLSSAVYSGSLTLKRNNPPPKMPPPIIELGRNIDATMSASTTMRITTNTYVSFIGEICILGVHIYTRDIVRKLSCKI